MKNYLLSMLALVSLASGMIHGSKFEDVFNAVEKQDRSRLKRELLQEGVITPPQFKQAIGEAEKIHKKLAESLTIFTSKKDLALLTFGSFFAYYFGKYAVRDLAIWQGWTKQLPDIDWENMIKQAQGHPGVRFHDTTSEERLACAISAAIGLGFFSGFCYMALRGYQCAYGSVAVENARLILEDLKKAERLSASDLG